MNRLIWIDMEMTGLDVERERIIEVAALITDLDFVVCDQYEAVLRAPQDILDQMDDWNRLHHTESGLLKKIPQGLDPEHVEDALIELIYKHFNLNEGKPVLCGNSIMQDRLFINKYFPRFAKLLHYRMCDVTSWKIIFQSKFNKKFEKKNSHRAIDDILESIAELKFYLQFMQR